MSKTVSSKFTFEIRWTKKGYWVNIFEGSGETMNEAKVKALELAKKNGWYPPKWWEMSRWKDSRIPRLD
jgi:hypothetical protein